MHPGEGSMVPEEELPGESATLPAPLHELSEEEPPPLAAPAEPVAFAATAAAPLKEVAHERRSKGQSSQLAAGRKGGMDAAC